MKVFVFKGFLFSLGLCIILGALGPLRQADPNTRVGRKLQGLEAEHDRITDVFVGSSLVSYNIVPTVYDSLRATANAPSYSYNLGVDGAHRLEIYHLVDEVLDRDLPKLERIVVELGRLALLPTDRPLTDQDAYYHDVRRVWLGTRASTTLGLTTEAEIGQLKMRWKMGLRRALLTGQGRTLLAALGQPEPRRIPLIQRIPVVQGYISLEDVSLYSDYVASSRTRFTAPEGQQAFRTLLADISSHPLELATPGRADSLVVDHVNGLVARAREKGVEIIFLVEPLNTTAREILAIRESIDAPVVSFYSYDRMNEMFLSGALFDKGHLKAWAARDFTRALADSLLPYVGSATQTVRPRTDSFVPRGL